MTESANMDIDWFAHPKYLHNILNPEGDSLAYTNILDTTAKIGKASPIL